MKSFTTTQDMTQYEVSQDYCEPYLGATHDDLHVARFNKYDTHIDKNEFFVYDDVNHKYNIYRRVEYIENTSNAYIDTYIIPDDNTGLKVKVLYTETLDKYFIGLRQGTNGRWCLGNNTNNYYWGYGSKYKPSSNALPNVFAEIYMNYKNNKSYKGINIETKDEYTDTLPTLGFKPTVSIRLFGANAWTDSSYIKCKIYSLQITQGEEIIRDFIPVKNTLTNQYGLLDTVEQKFYISPNGVEFNGGNEIIDMMEIHPKLITNTYIDQNTGNQQGYNGWSSSDYIDVEGFNYIQVPYPFRYSDYKYGAYYDKDKKRISNTASLTIPSNAKYVRLSSTTSNFTNVWLFKKQLITTDIYRANSYVETNGSIKSYNGWNILNTDSEYNYFYFYEQSYRYQASYNADGSVYQSGRGFLQKPEGGKVLLSDGNTSITYYAGYNYMYKDMNK